MLGDYPVDVMLLATDLGVARRFYEGTLGLAVLVEDEQFLTFRCGGDSRLVVTKSTAGTADTATKASWRVADLAAESRSCGRGACRSRTSRSWASPTSGSRWRPGSPTRTTTPSASSSSSRYRRARHAGPAGEMVTARWR